MQKKRQWGQYAGKKKWIETVPVEAITLDFLDKDFKSSLTYPQRDKGSHVQRIKENDENDVSLNRQYEWRWKL